MSQLEKRRLSYDEVIKMTPTRLERASFHLRDKTIGNGNCYIYALLDQMTYVLYICLYTSSMMFNKLILHSTTIVT